MATNPYYTLKITIDAGQPTVICVISSPDPINPRSPQKDTGRMTLVPPKKGSTDYIWYFDKGNDGKYNGTMTFQDPKYLNSPIAFGSNPSAANKLTGGVYSVDYTPVPNSSNSPARTTTDEPGFEARIP